MTTTPQKSFSITIGNINANYRACFDDSYQQFDPPSVVSSPVNSTKMATNNEGPIELSEVQPSMTLQVDGHAVYPAHATTSDNFDILEDEPLPPIKVKEALTYSLTITIFHEVAGTFLFVYSILAVATSQAATSLTDVAFAIAAAAFVYSHVFQKAHFNTWITLYLFLTDWLGRSFDAELIELYPDQYRGAKAIPRDSKRAVRFMSFVHMISQLVGSTLAALLIWEFPGTNADNIGNTAVARGFMYPPTDTYPNARAIFVVMLLEFCITYALLYSLDIGDESNHRPGRSKAVFFSVGPPIVLFLGVRTVGEFTGASFNLARTFGPALVSGNWGNGAIGYYAVAQFLAVVMAVVVEQYRFKKHIRNRRKELKLIEEAKELRRSAAASRRATTRSAQTSHALAPPRI